MEQLSLASFLANGHQYHLYVYEQPKNIPAGTIVKDAGEILPSSRVFRYKEQASYSGFSNFFRYKLLLERGGWWVDTDTVCIRPFDFEEDLVFSSELDNGVEVITSAIIKAPRASELMAYCWEVCQSKDPEHLIWGETGPQLMSQAVSEFSLEKYRQPHFVFCPLAYTDWQKALEADSGTLANRRTHAVHLWNEMWRRAGMDKNGSYDSACLYEKLKRKYLHQSPLHATDASRAPAGNR